MIHAQHYGSTRSETHTYLQTTAVSIQRADCRGGSVGRVELGPVVVVDRVARRFVRLPCRRVHGHGTGGQGNREVVLLRLRGPIWHAVPAELPVKKYCVCDLLYMYEPAL
jgi:hypothetical protein